MIYKIYATPHAFAKMAGSCHYTPSRLWRQAKTDGSVNDCISITNRNGHVLYKLRTEKLGRSKTYIVHVADVDVREDSTSFKNAYGIIYLLNGSEDWKTL